MGEEADYLEGQSDGGAEEDMRRMEMEDGIKYRREHRRFANAVKLEVARQLRAHGIMKTEQIKYVQRGATATYKCRNCQGVFVARIADRKRGWARFCSKSCKAVFQDARTGGVYRDQYVSLK